MKKSYKLYTWQPCKSLHAGKKELEGNMKHVLKLC